MFFLSFRVKRNCSFFLNGHRSNSSALFRCKFPTTRHFHTHTHYSQWIRSTSAPSSDFSFHLTFGMIIFFISLGQPFTLFLSFFAPLLSLPFTFSSLLFTLLRDSSLALRPHWSFRYAFNCSNLPSKGKRPYLVHTCQKWSCLIKTRTHEVNASVFITFFSSSFCSSCSRYNWSKSSELLCRARVPVSNLYIWTRGGPFFNFFMSAFAICVSSLQCCPS